MENIGFVSVAALGLLALVPLVMLLYFMKLRRREKVVSSNFLWSRALEQARVDSFFQKLRVNLLLLLQILVIALAALALARPYVHTRGSLGPELVIVMDDSAGVQAREPGGTRLEQIQRAASRLVDEAFEGTRITLVAASSRPRVLASFSTDKHALRHAVDTLPPTDAALSLRPAVLLALSIAGTHPGSEVYVIAQRTPEAAMAESLGSRFHFIPIGRSVPNAAITAFLVRSLPSGRGQVFVECRNFGAEAVHGTLELHRGALLGDAREIDLPARGDRSFVFDVPAAGANDARADVLHAHLNVSDALAVDNDAWTVLPDAHRSRVLLVTGGNPFLERALALMPGHQVFKVRPADYRPADRFDVTIWDGIEPQGSGPAIILGAPSPDVRKGPFELTWDRSHPIFRHIDLSELHVAELRKLAVAPESRVLSSTGDGLPVVWLEEKPGTRRLWVGFDIYRTDWPLSVTFPIFVANGLQFLEAGGVGHPPTQVAVEAPIPLEFLEGTGPVDVTLPGGTRLGLSGSDHGASFGQTEQAGVYSFSSGGRTWHVAANLLDPDSSDLTPPAPLAAGNGHAATAAAAAVPASREIWWPILLAAFCLLCFEWYYYHRRL